MNVSYSRISAYMDCPQKHYFSYVRRLSPNKPIKALTFGSDFHRLLQYRGSKAAVKKIMQEIEQTWEDLSYVGRSELGDDYVKNLKTIFNDYMRRWKNLELPTQTEIRFDIPIGHYKGEPVFMAGVIDERYDTAEGVIICEHKTFSKAPDMDMLVMNQQSCIYAKAEELIYGTKPTRIRWDYIRSIPASMPVWLDKSKRLSEAATTSVTPYSWLRACKLHDIEDEETIAKGEKYAINLPNFFFRTDIDVNPLMVDRIWDDAITVAKLICSKGSTNQVKRISRDCSWCSYRPLCHAEFTGVDMEYIIQRDFVEKGD